MAFTSRVNTPTRNWMMLPTGWDSAWKTARTAASSTPAYVAVIGDSNAQGYSTTDAPNKAFPVLLRNKLVAKYGLYGDYYSSSMSTRFMTSTGATAVPGTMPWTFDTTWNTTAAAMNNGFGFTMYQDGTTYPAAWVNAGSGSFLTPYACTAFDIIYHDSVAGTWQYNIDNAAGGGLVTNTNGAWNSMRRIAVTGQTNATHTVRVGASSVQYACGINGIVTYDPTNNKTKGIGFANVSGIAQAAELWMASPNGWPADRIQQWQGRSKTAAATEQLTGFGFPTQPHLAIVELGINDCQANYGVIQFRSALRRFVDALRRGRDGCSVLFVICPNPDNATTDTTVEYTRAESWSMYADQIYGVAAEMNCAVFNIHADWLPTSVTQGFTAANDPHPTDTGHQAIADALSPLIV